MAVTPAAHTLARIRLDAPLGADAWGEVWRGMRGGVPVAVKVLRGDADTRARMLLEDEIRVMARLDHPGIVPLLDHGLVPDDAPEPFAAGSPYLVMPLADGSLDRQGPCTDLAGWMAVVEPLLAALAHLHARGLVHRDVKPANVLVYLRPERYLLADLGIAWHEAAGLRERAGTPRYMSPEQTEGRWRELGPWTDLYALGRLGTELLSGDPDVESASFEVPDHLWRWLAHLTRPDPRARYPDVAEARRALGASSPRGNRVPVSSGVSGTAASGASTPAEGTWRPTACPPSGEDALPAPVGRLMLREPPFAGREHLRARLWEAVTPVAGARLLVVHGESGLGASRLARWLCESVAEAGTAPVWRFEFPQAGLRTGVLRRFRAAGLVGAELRSHLAAVGAPTQDALVELIEDESLPPAARAHRVLAALSEARTPPVVWLDDVDGNEEARALVSLWRERGEPPALFLATARTPPTEAPWSDGEVHALEPLADTEIAEMLERWLAVSPHLAAEIAARSTGSPLVAEQLAEDLARRGALIRSEAGWVHTPGATISLPATAQALWSFRVAALGLSREDRAVLDAAAVLGERVDLDHWRAVAERDPMDVRRALLDAGLARVDGPAIRFVHGQLRETLLRGADVATLHARAGAVLAAAGADPGDVGRHLAAAGQPLDAVQPLLDGSRLARDRYWMTRSGELAELAIVCAERAALGEDDPRRAGAWVLSAQSRSSSGQFGESVRMFEEAWRLALRSGAWTFAGAAAFGLADAANQAGETADAER